MSLGGGTGSGGGSVLESSGNDSLVLNSELLSDVGESLLGQGVVVVSPVVDVGQVFEGDQGLKDLEASQVGDLELGVGSIEVLR